MKRSLEVSPSAGAPLKTGHLLPKKGPPGSVHLEFKRCNRDGCACAAGPLHGPYGYLHHRDAAGRQHKTYLPRRLVPAVRKEIERRRTDPAYWSTRRLMTALRWLLEGGP